MPADKEIILKNYVTNLKSNIYCVKNLPPEVVAVLFAYISRSPDSFRDNLLKLILDKDIDLAENYKDKTDTEFSHAKDKAKEFHEKWVVGYGHSSVAEHADLKFAFEDISIIATKIIEDCRLAGFTEKSTRYQVFDKGRFYYPKNLMRSGDKNKITALIEKLFFLYNDFYKPVENFIRQNEPGKTNIFYKSKTCDVIRYLLPAGTLTSLAMSVNAREAAYAIVKFKSHPLKEIQNIGKLMLEEGIKICPTLLKYTEPSEFLIKGYKCNDDIPDSFTGKLVNNREQINDAILIDSPNDAEEKLIAAIIYRKHQIEYKNALELVKQFTNQQKENLITEYLAGRSEHEQLPRETEHLVYQMEIVIDYGAFRDIQRHRIATQTNPLLSTQWGYEIPDIINNIGGNLLFEYNLAMTMADEVYNSVCLKYPYEAGYLVPLAFRKRVLFTWNLREIEYFVRLRSKPQGHISYRRIAMQILNLIKEKHPLIVSIIER